LTASQTQQFDKALNPPNLVGTKSVRDIWGKHLEMTTYDIAFVGSGIACSMTLCQLAQRLTKRPPPNKLLRICVIEKEGESWNGIPYGRRSTIGALAFQKLHEFLDEPERGKYIEWLAANAESWLTTLRKWGTPGADKWISDNQAFMEQNRWEELYLPRFLFGLYVSDSTARAIQELSKGGIATLTLIHGEAIEASRTPGGPFTIVVEDGDGARTNVHAMRVAFAIGSPPQRSIHNCVDGQSGFTHIDDLYSPSEDANIRKIEETLGHLPDKNMANILIVGSNASALEVLYLLTYRPRIRDLIKSVVVLSRSGKLPYKICEDRVLFELSALQAVSEFSHISAADVMAAIRSDVRRAEEMKVNVADLRDAVSAAVSRAVSMLDSSEQRKFVCEHGVHYSGLMRRAGRDTRNAADELASAGILATVKGEFRRLEPFPSGTGPMVATYAVEGCQSEIRYPVSFSVTINCGGFEELDCCSSRLINSVVTNRLCRVNSTRRGFFVNERLEASEECYVIGPLLGGNFNTTCRYWHVESASRISGLAKLLAESLSSSIFPSADVVAQTLLISRETQIIPSIDSSSGRIV
jgi:uncharacterized NAD(P)/FAD-binding protein YdhS